MANLPAKKPDAVGDIPFSTSKVDVTELIDSLKQRTGVRKIIAFSGGADQGFGDDATSELTDFLSRRMEEHIQQAILYLSSYNIAVLTGGTSFGVPAAASRMAKNAGLVTIGVHPRTGAKHALSESILDLRICVEPRFEESCWGDESAIFSKLLDGVIVYGGGAGTLVEMAHILKINESRLKNNHPPKLIIPISGSGGTADVLPFFPAKVRVRGACMPAQSINSGLQAAKELERSLDLFDYIKR